MKILEVLCHPRPASLNLALAASVEERLVSLGHQVFFHDLYSEGFDPVLSGPELARSSSLDSMVQAYCEELAAADGLLIFHPDWWGQPPALLKGWVDRVFRQGVAYEYDGEDFMERKWTPLLGGKKGLVFCTSDVGEGDLPRTLETLWTEVILGRCGMKAACHVLRGVGRADPAARKAWRESILSTVSEWFPAEVRVPARGSP